MGIDYYASNNKKFYISIKTTLDAYGYVSLFDEKGETLLLDIKSSYEIGGTRGAVSNDGKLFATAAYSHKGIDLRNINGNLIWNNKEIKKIQGLAFSSDNQYLYVWNGDEPEYTYYVRISDGVVERRIVASWIKPSLYSEDLILSKEDTLIIDSKKIKASSFCFLDVTTTKEGICVSPVGEELIMYDYHGKLLWKSKFVKENEGNYIVQLISDESYIYGLSLNNTVYRINIIDGASEVIKNNIKFIINNKNYIDTNDVFATISK